MSADSQNTEIPENKVEKQPSKKSIQAKINLSKGRAKRNRDAYIKAQKKLDERKAKWEKEYGQSIDLTEKRPDNLAETKKEEKDFEPLDENDDTIVSVSETDAPEPSFDDTETEEEYILSKAPKPKLKIKPKVIESESESDYPPPLPIRRAKSRLAYAISDSEESEAPRPKRRSRKPRKPSSESETTEPEERKPKKITEKIAQSKTKNEGPADPRSLLKKSEVALIF